VDLKTHKVLLVSSTAKSDEWIFPKGGWEVYETLQEAAVRETREEAGVEGVLADDILIAYKTAPKSETKPGCYFQIIELHYTADSPRWKEREERRRQWFSYEEAITIVNPIHREALRRSSLNPVYVVVVFSHFSSDQLTMSLLHRKSEYQPVYEALPEDDDDEKEIKLDFTDGFTPLPTARPPYAL
jgi:8-oxo-dGTP pyrophosphatase MutT (NUDIX family)